MDTERPTPDAAAAGTPLQVLVVGAGPTGLTTAHELLRRGIAVRLVDAAPAPATTSRALATHARTLEIYDQMGILPQLLPQGRPVQRFTLHQNGRTLAALRADYSQLPTRYPMTLMVDQAITERVLRDAVARLGTRTEWGVRLETLHQDGTGVTTVLRHADGRTETVRCDWLVGCDGGHSTIRKQLGLKLVGESSETWLIADAELDAGLDDRSLHWLRTRSSALMAVPFPQPGKWRLLDTAEARYDGDAQAVGARFARKLTEALGRPVTVRTPSWVSVFTIQQRMITAMRSGRCFVAGDAAHVHSPASGQGMNTGIQDAYNLAWKLAAVLRGHSAETLLDSYAAERVPVGEQLLGSTNRATRLIQMSNPLVGLVLPVMFTAVRNVQALHTKISRKIMRAMSALDLSYAAGPLSVPPPAAATPCAGPPPGYRLACWTGEHEKLPAVAAAVEELRDPRWTLYTTGPATTTASIVGTATGTATTGPATAVTGAASASPGPPEPARAAADWLSVRTLGDGGTGPGALEDRDGTLRALLALADGGDWILVRPDGYVAARGTGPDPAPLASALAAVTAGTTTATSTP
ncbi:FAD-dependent oxidoreductase [Streptantibioticus silvisoli]|uniref:FAD-dependent oxidoreductase n=1 Tax=Streptantibioticus silvisoli TaxID=2705255 RepID=A0ABT6W9B1_9ACTN|nr:FAD-dependent oxidoreductase [Streptantibioticus silvisoli]MDI5967325.1 FAD-dependent oxidoreductase [Streptantibioticus silvisoli]